MGRIVFAIVVILVLAWIISSPDAVAVDIRQFFHDIYNSIAH